MVYPPPPSRFPGYTPLPSTCAPTVVADVSTRIAAVAADAHRLQHSERPWPRQRAVNTHTCGRRRLHRRWRRGRLPTWPTARPDVQQSRIQNSFPLCNLFHQSPVGPVLAHIDPPARLSRLFHTRKRAKDVGKRGGSAQRPRSATMAGSGGKTPSVRCARNGSSKSASPRVCGGAPRDERKLGSRPRLLLARHT